MSSFWLSCRCREFLTKKSGLLLARESCLDISQSMKLSGHLSTEEANFAGIPRGHRLWHRDVLCWKKERMRGTHEMCLLTLPTHSWKSLVHPVSYRMSVQETLKDSWYCSIIEEASWDLLPRFGNNCSVRILVAWIEFLQPLQLWRSIPSELHIKGSMSKAKYTLHYQNFQVQLSGDGRETPNGNQSGQLCHKLSKAATS